MHDVTISYFSFETTTYAPVTIDTIEKYPATCRFVISASGREAEILRRTLEKATKGQFDNKLVRFKASGLVEQEVFIDRKGGVLFGRGGIERQLSQNDLNTIQTLMESLPRGHGCEL